MNKYIYIDESGDVGLTNRKKPYFVMSAVVVDSKNSKLIQKDIAELKKRIKWPSEAEFKFSKTRKDIINDTLDILSEANLDIYVLIYDKKTDKTAVSGKSVYNELLLKLIKSIDERKVDIIVDGGFGRKYQRKMKTYIRKNVDNKEIANFRYADSVSEIFLQLADLAAGATSRHLRKEDAFYNKIKHKIILVG